MQFASSLNFDICFLKYLAAHQLAVAMKHIFHKPVQVARSGTDSAIHMVVSTSRASPGYALLNSEKVIAAFQIPRMN